MKRNFLLQLLAALVLCAALARPAGALDVVRVGSVKLTAGGPLFVALDRGYFKDEGIDVEPTWFQSPAPIPVAVASGAIDIGATASSAAIYALGAGGALKIIGSQGHEAKGFHVNAFAVSNRAYAAGLKTYRDLRGHTIGVADFGGPGQYAASLILQKYAVPLATVQFVALQSNPNVLSAVVGGRTDAAVLAATVVTPAASKGDVKIIGWVGDETPWQSGVVFASTKLLDRNPDLVRRFLVAYRKATRAWHDAFAAPDGTRRDGPDARQFIALLMKTTGQSEAQVRLGISYVDPDAGYDLADLRRQIAWFEAQKMLKANVSAAKLIDRRFIRLIGEK